MAKTKNIIICSIFLVIIIFSGFFGFSSAFTHATNEGTNENVFNVQVLSQDYSELPGVETTYNGAKAYKFKRKYNDGNRAQYFKPKFDFSSINGLSTTEGVHAMTFSYQFLAGYDNTNWTQVDETSYEPIIRENKEDFFHYTFNITISNWGIYKFKCDVSGMTWETAYFIIEPVTTEIETVPNINYSTKTSLTGTGLYFYHFSLKNKSAYDYIDEKALKWYVLGTATDGKKYVLEEDDKLRDEMSDAIALKTSIHRTGFEFVLDVPQLYDNKEISAVWEVWCEYNPYPYTAEIKASNIIEVTTGKATSNLPIILGLSGLVLLLILTTIITIVIKTRHEKIY